MSRAQGVWWRAGRVVLALVLGLVGCELALQLVSSVNRALHRRDGGGAGGAERVWVCIGDSNTYGVFEDPEDAYPAVLERLLATYAPDEDVRVVNLGMPATNVAQATEVLADALETYRPELALVLAGVNNSWSWHAGEGDERAGPPWYERLRLVRLARLLARGDSSADPDTLIRVVPSEGGREVSTTDRAGRRVTFTADGRPLADAALFDSIVRDLGSLVRLAPEPCRPVLLTYGWDDGLLATANAAIRSVAADEDALLIDCAARLAPVRAALPEEALFYPDRHMRALGYEHFARAVLEGLAEAGRVRLARPLEPFAGEPRRAPAPSLEWPAGARLPLVHIDSGDPGRPLVVVLSGAEGDRFAELGGRTLTVHDDEVYRTNLLATALLGTTDAAGRATVDLAALTRSTESLSGRAFRVAYVLYQGVGRPKVREVSDAARFEVR